MALSLRGSLRLPRTALLFLWLALLLWGVSAALALRPPEAAGGGGAPAGSALRLRSAVPAGEPQEDGRAEENRTRLLSALEEEVERYATPLQLLGTAPYYSSEAALDTVLRWDGTVTEAAERCGVEKAMVQAVLFQELRFLNLLDEVDRCVEATHTYLQRSEERGPLSPPPLRPPVYRLDSSTGLGQIFAGTAIEAINWREGRQVWDGGDWHDVRDVWSRLRGDDSYNIQTVALVLSYKRGVLQKAGVEEPSPGDIMQAYNGTGELSRRYREAVCAYYAAFRQYGEG